MLTQQTNVADAILLHTWFHCSLCSLYNTQTHRLHYKRPHMIPHTSSIDSSKLQAGAGAKKTLTEITMLARSPKSERITMSFLLVTRRINKQTNERTSNGSIKVLQLDSLRYTYMHVCMAFVLISLGALLLRNPMSCLATKPQFSLLSFSCSILCTRTTKNDSSE